MRKRPSTQGDREEEILDESLRCAGQHLLYGRCAGQRDNWRMGQCLARSACSGCRDSHVPRPGKRHFPLPGQSLSRPPGPRHCCSRPAHRPHSTHTDRDRRRMHLRQSAMSSLRPDGNGRHATDRCERQAMGRAEMDPATLLHWYPQASRVVVDTCDYVHRCNLHSITRRDGKFGGQRCCHLRTVVRSHLSHGGCCDVTGRGCR